MVSRPASEPHPPPLIYLSDQRSLFLGQPPPSSGRFSIVAARLILSLQGPLYYQLEEQGPRRRASGLLLPAGLRIALDTRQALIADLYLDTPSEFQHLQQLTHARSLHLGVREEAGLRATFCQLHVTAPSAAQCWERLEPWLAPVDRTLGDYAEDPRVARTRQRIQQSARENLAAEQLAQEVGLSASRLACLFKQEMGMPIRHYRLWRRLYQAIVHLSQGASLTEAALASGFSDSSHFSRTYVQLLGIQPSALTRSHCGLKILHSSPEPAPYG
jgi:AraC-like DNA-binding protein